MCGGGGSKKDKCGRKSEYEGNTQSIERRENGKNGRRGNGAGIQKRNELEKKKSCCKAVGDECMGSRLGFKAYGSGFRFEGLGEATISRLLKILGLVCRI